jgi:predicted GNAT family acetyltransferase
MSDQQATPPVVDDPGQGRFFAEQDGGRAELIYELDGDRLILIHTRVPESLGGRGLGGELVRAAVAKAVRQDLTIAPWCPYARKWLTDHPEAAGDVKIDWSAPPAL